MLFRSLPRESRFVIFHPGSVPHLFMIGEEKTRKKNPSGVSAHIVGNKVRLFFTRPDTVVVTDNNWKNEKIGVSHVHAPVDISDDWQVSFPPASGAPDTVHLSKLESLSENSSDSIRYFAGTATYNPSSSAILFPIILPPLPYCLPIVIILICSIFLSF